jgi:hypothetical protein
MIGVDISRIEVKGGSSDSVLVCGGVARRVTKLTVSDGGGGSSYALLGLEF